LAGFGTATVSDLSFWTADVTRGRWDASGNFFLGIATLAPRYVSAGAPDSGGTGYRLLVIAN
jgi:hypothetical protein